MSNNTQAGEHAADSLESRLAAWVQQVCGAPVESLKLIPGGASRRSYSVALDDGRRFFLRVDTGEGPLSGTEMNLDRERRFIAPVCGRDLPVPAIVEYNEDLNALLMEHVEGFTSYQKSLPDDMQRQLEAELIRVVCALQALDPAELGLPDHASRGTVGAAIDKALAMWRELYETRVPNKDPVTLFALEWLANNVPDRDSPSVLVHGDVGPGNFLFSEAGELKALIDWELAHIGHPLEDLACILCRALGVDFGSPEHLIGEYEVASGRSVDRETLNYCVVLMLTEWSVGIQMALSRTTVNQDVAMLFLWGHVNRFEIMRKIGANSGREMPTAGSLPEIEMEWAYLPTHLTASLEEVILPAASDEFIAHRTRALIQLQKVQTAMLRYGIARFEAEEVQWAEKLTGQHWQNYAEARAALLKAAADAARKGEPGYIDYLLWRTARERLLLEEALGPMAQRSVNY